LKPKPAESDDDRKPAATRTTHSRTEAKKKSTKRAPYNCICGNKKKDHICPFLLKNVEIQTVKRGDDQMNVEIQSDDDQEILVRDYYEACHLQADETEASEQNDSIEVEDSLKDTGQGAGRSKDDDADDAEGPRSGIEETETAQADSVEDSQSAQDKASDAGNTAQTCHEESAATPAKRKDDSDATSRLAKRSKNDESPQPEDSKETDSTSGPVEVPPRNDQDTIAANARTALYVDSDEEIETVPV
jgi:hypothetical protein